MSKIHIIITDDHPMVITGLTNILMKHPDFILLAAYTSGNDLLEGLKIHKPDVLMLDVQLPDWSGSELAGMIVRKYPDIRILSVTSMDASFHVVDMLQQGCLGYILKNTDEQSLIKAIEQVASGEQYIDPSLKEALLETMLKTRRKTNKMPALTAREKEVLQLIASEYSNQEIADKLFIAVRTVETHRFSIMQKMDVKNTVGLVRLALQMGLVR